jgi:hypothetical protein
MTLSITKYVQGHIYQTASSLNILKGKKYKCGEAMIQQAYVYYNITVSSLPCFFRFANRNHQSQLVPRKS